MSVGGETRWPLSWHERASEEAAHFNPAFCGELIVRTIGDYMRVRGNAFPLALTFLILPLTLPPAIRTALPRRADTAFASWASDNAELLTTIPDRVLHLRPVTREALLFMTQVNALRLTGDGVEFGTSPLRLSGRLSTATQETGDIRRAASMIGRWFAAQGAPAAVLQTMGVRV